MNESQEPEHEFPQVPVEITRSIVELINDRPTLASLSRTSRTFNHEAERVLYREPFPCSREQSVALLEVIAVNQRVAAYVRTLIVDLTDGRHVDPFQPELQAQEHPQPTCTAQHGNESECFSRCMCSLANALKNMPKLRVLKIFPDVTYDSATSAWPLQHCAGRLLELRCGFSWDEDLVAFLSDQPSIVDLCLEHNLDVPSRTIPDSLVPRLSKFEGMPSTAAKICPGRPITHVSMWLNDTSNLPSLISQVALSTKPIVSLELGDYNVVSLSEIILAGVHIHMPQLRFLGPCIITPWDVSHSSSPLCPIELTQIHLRPPDKEETCLSDIALFKHLHTLLLLDYERQPLSPNALGIPAQRTFVENLQVACPSLRRVVFSYSVGEPCSYLWSFDSGGWVSHENRPLRFLWRDI